MPVTEKFFVFKEQIKHNDENILNCIEYLNLATDKHNVTIKFVDNAGGSVEDIHALIQAIEKTKAKNVLLVFTNYAISAVAYLLAYFEFNYFDKKIKIEKSENLCLIYHRPRLITEDAIIFANLMKPGTLDNEVEFYLVIMSYCFDLVFYKMINSLFSTNKNYYLMFEKMYTTNGDVSFII